MNHLKNIIETNNKNVQSGYVYVSTVDTFDTGLETMVFMCDVHGDVLDWSGLDTDRYYTEEEAEAGHRMMLAKWGNLAAFS